MTWSRIHFDYDNRAPKDTPHGGGFGLMVPVDEPRVWRPNNEDSRCELYSEGESERRLPYPSLSSGGCVC